MAQQYMKLAPFIIRHSLFIAIIIIIPLVLFFFVLYRSSNHNQSNPGKIINASAKITKDGIEKEEKNLGWTRNTFTNDDLNGINAAKTVLPDGSVQYSFSSDTPTRPQEIRVKNGITIFQRTPVSDTTTKEYTTYYGKPDFFAKGSYFWGTQAITYIYIKSGFAFVVNTQTGMAVEQMFFQPVSEKVFKATYDADLIGDLQPY